MRQRRAIRPGATVHVINRTLRHMLRLKPEARLVVGIEARLIRLQRRHRMTIHAYVFMSNHFHLVVTIRSVHQLSAFMRDLQSAVARLSQRVFGGPRLFWAPRYRAQVLCTDAAIRRKVRYVTAHGAKERLVRSPRLWPGPTCARQMADASTAPRLRVVGADGVTRHWALQLSPVPADVDLDHATWRRRQAKLVDSIDTEYADGAVAGVAAVMARPALCALDGAEDSFMPMVSWDCHDADFVVDAAQLAEEVEHYATTVGAREDAVRRMVLRGVEGVPFPSSSVMPDVIPRPLRRALAQQAETEAEVCVGIERVPGTLISPARRASAAVETADFGVSGEAGRGTGPPK